MNDNEETVVNFLKLIIAGQIDEAFQKYISSSGKHHNVYTPAGFIALKKGMQQSENESPNKEFSIKQVVSSGDMVAIFSHLKMKPDGLGMSVLHMFKIKDGKIIEMWDMAQSIPKESPNTDGPF